MEWFGVTIVSLEKCDKFQKDSCDFSLLGQQFLVHWFLKKRERKKD